MVRHVALLAVLLLAAAPAAARASAAPSIERIARVVQRDAVLSGDDRYVAVSAGEGAVRVYDTRRRRTRRVRGTCQGVADVEAHRMLVAIRSAGCAPAVVDLTSGETAAPLDIAPAVAPQSCPRERRGYRACPRGTAVEEHVAIAGEWILGVAHTVGGSDSEDQRVVARRIDTGELRVLVRAPSEGAVALESADGNHAVVLIDEPGAEEGEIFPDRRVSVDLRSGAATPLPAAEYLFAVDGGRALVSDNGQVRRLTLRPLPGAGAKAARIRLRRPLRIHDAAAGAGAVAWMVQKRRPRRLAINLLIPGGRERLFLTHRPPRPRDDYLCARILPTRYAIVWSVIPGYCNRTGRVDFYAARRQG